jgi:hypothetical protein
MASEQLVAAAVRAYIAAREKATAAYQASQEANKAEHEALDELRKAHIAWRGAGRAMDDPWVCDDLIVRWDSNSQSQYIMTKLIRS